MGDTRSFDQDPRFGAAVLAEIASRALSPAVNDPGTAIDVISRALRVLAVWTEPVEKALQDEVLYPKVYVPAIELDEVFDDLFTRSRGTALLSSKIGVRLQEGVRHTRQVQPGPVSRCSHAAFERSARASGSGTWHCQRSAEAEAGG